MIEIIYKEEQKKAGGNEQYFRVPNNIRQIGEIKGHQRIYIEDYAYTFLRKISRNQAGSSNAAILLGKYNWSEGTAYLFIKSALQIREMEVSPDHMVFSDKVWGQIYEESKTYFPDQEIVGWFVSLPGFNMQISEGILKTHLNHFAGNDKVLFVMEPGEREEAFFLYEGGHLSRQPGYYIYYEKNEEMQAYMIERNQNKSIEETEKIPDRAVVDFRKAVREKREKEKEAAPEKKGKGRWIAGACTAAAVLAVGITFFNSYQGMKNTMGTLTGTGETNEAAQMETAQSSSDQVLISPETLQGTEQQSDEPENQEPETPEENGTAEDASSQGESGDAQGWETDRSEEDGNDAAPDTETPENQESQGEETAGAPEAVRSYVIQKGDTLSSICENQYGSVARVEEICRLNGISPEDIIYAGQTILLPQ